MEAVAFFGLGRMGQGMALRLVESGYRVYVYNRTPEKAEAVVRKGAKFLDSPTAAAEPATVLITMLSDDEAVAEVVDRPVLNALGRGNIHLSMSTLSPAAARGFAGQHADLGVQYVACPVFGRPDAAQAGKLGLCLAGEETARERLRPLLGVLGQKTYEFGTDPAAANVVKLAGNFLIASSIQAMAEAFSLVEKNGVDPAAVYGLLTEGLFACPIYNNYGRAILERNYEPAGFTLSLGAKDMRLVRDAARNSRVSMPLAAILEDRFLRSLAQGQADMDWTAIALSQLQDAALIPQKLE